MSTDTCFHMTRRNSAAGATRWWIGLPTINSGSNRFRSARRLSRGKSAPRCPRSRRRGESPSTPSWPTWRGSFCPASRIGNRPTSLPSSRPITPGRRFWARCFPLGWGCKACSGPPAPPALSWKRTCSIGWPQCWGCRRSSSRSAPGGRHPGLRVQRRAVRAAGGARTRHRLPIQ